MPLEETPRIVLVVQVERRGGARVYLPHQALLVSQQKVDAVEPDEAGGRDQGIQIGTEPRCRRGRQPHAADRAAVEKGPTRARGRGPLLVDADDARAAAVGQEQGGQRPPRLEALEVRTGPGAATGGETHLRPARASGVLHEPPRRASRRLPPDPRMADAEPVEQAEEASGVTHGGDDGRIVAVEPPAGGELCEQLGPAREPGAVDESGAA